MSLLNGHVFTLLQRGKTRIYKGEKADPGRSWWIRFFPLGIFLKFQRKWLLSFRGAECSKTDHILQTDRKVDPSSTLNISKRIQIFSLKLLGYSKDHELLLRTQLYNSKKTLVNLEKKVHEGESFWDFSCLVPASSTCGRNVSSKKFNQFMGFLR